MSNLLGILFLVLIVSLAIVFIMYTTEMIVILLTNGIFDSKEKITKDSNMPSRGRI